MIIFGCSKCDSKFEVPDEYVGKWVICKKCNISVAIPTHKIQSSWNNGNRYNSVEITMQEDYRFVNIWDIGRESHAVDPLEVDCFSSD